MAGASNHRAHPATNVTTMDFRTSIFSRFTRQAAITAAAALLLFLCAGGALAEELMGRVIKVADGDTITVQLANKKKERIRFLGIDAPEHDQAYGAEARTAMNKLANSKMVKVVYEQRDMYGRIVGQVFVDGRDLGMLMLRMGLAWHYKQYSNSKEYAASEEAARQAKVGLWHDPSPVPPWEFRREQKRQRQLNRAATSTPKKIISAQ